MARQSIRLAWSLLSLFNMLANATVPILSATTASKSVIQTPPAKAPTTRRIAGVANTDLPRTRNLGRAAASINLAAPSSGLIGTMSIGGGGFLGTNAQGKCICRQCSLPGHYKDSKCRKKWGPGPEGTGTVCDRCHKKMKRVKRRGTLDSQHLANAAHNPPTAIHPSAAAMQHPPTNGRNSQVTASASDRSLHRSDTIPTNHMSNARALGPSDNRSRPPTPPYITTLSGGTTSSETEESGAGDCLLAHRINSHVASPDSTAGCAQTTTNGQSRTRH
ncbi:hypothetical protein EIP86_004160 [Pleurotus ostreatoroseus]|nr:hypothetical protein EIP86_004160 [Pleurotus ostreatoroseus]